MKRLLAIFLLILLCSPANALRFTESESYTDPDYAGYTPKIIILLVAETSNEMRKIIEDALTREFEKRDVTLISYRSVFPPTRVWSEEDQAKLLKSNNIDSGLIVTAGANSASVIPIATQTYKSTNVFGSYGSHGLFNANANSTTTSHNILKAKSIAEFSAVLLDIENNRTAWYADITTKAGGTLFVGAKGDAKGASKGVIQGLERDGHILKIKKNTSAQSGQRGPSGP